MRKPSKKVNMMVKYSLGYSKGPPGRVRRQADCIWPEKDQKSAKKAKINL
jgi:hypothetical protein